MIKPNCFRMIKNYLKFSLLTFFFSFCLMKSANSQSIVSIAQDSAFVGQTLNVVITGNSTSFGQGTSTTQVWLSQGSTLIPSNSVTVTNTTQMTVNFTIPTVPAAAPTGFYNVNVYESIDNFLTLTNGFKVVSATVGIAENTDQISAGKAYPNPFSNALQLEYSLIEESLVQITMFDISGKVILEPFSEKYPAGDYKYEFDLRSAEVPAGIYFIRLRINEKDHNYKVIKN